MASPELKDRVAMMPACNASSSTGPAASAVWPSVSSRSFPPHTCYVEAFAGGASVLFHKEPSHIKLINDINGEVTNLYRVVQHHLDEFVRPFHWSLVSRQIFEWTRMSEPRPLTDVQRAARLYYLRPTAFGGKVSGQSFGCAASAPPSFSLLRIEEDLSQAICAARACSS